MQGLRTTRSAQQRRAVSNGVRLTGAAVRRNGVSRPLVPEVKAQAQAVEAKPTSDGATPSTPAPSASAAAAPGLKTVTGPIAVLVSSTGRSSSALGFRTSKRSKSPINRNLSGLDESPLGTRFDWQTGCSRLLSCKACEGTAGGRLEGHCRCGTPLVKQQGSWSHGIFRNLSQNRVHFTHC